MYIYDESTRSFAEAKKDPKKKDAKKSILKRIGTLSISIPTRKRFIDRKGRKRRVAMKFETPLLGGGSGAMEARAVMKNLASELSNRGPVLMTQKNYRNIIRAFMPK